jgi:hypothetical protein
LSCPNIAKGESAGLVFASAEIMRGRSGFFSLSLRPCLRSPRGFLSLSDFSRRGLSDFGLGSRFSKALPFFSAKKRVQAWRVWLLPFLPLFLQA